MDFITDDFIDYIIRVEGSRKRRGKHYPYKSAEGGRKTVGYGHKIKNAQEARSFSSGLTENQARLLLASDLSDAAEGVQRSIGKSWDTLDANRKQMLVGMQFNLGSVKKKFPKFTKAVIENDHEGMVREFKRSYKPSMETGKKVGWDKEAGVPQINPDKRKTKRIPLETRNREFYNQFLANKTKEIVTGEQEMPQEQEQDMGMTLAANEDREWQTIPENREKRKNREKDINEELQKQMHPDAQKKDAFSQAETEQYFAKAEKSKEAIKNDYRTIVAKGMKLIHKKEARENMLKALSVNNPVESVANVTQHVIARIDKALRSAGRKVSDEVKALAANNIMGQILEVGEASGVVQLDENEKELAFSMAINKYLNAEIKAGRIDPKMLSEETGRSVANMSTEQRSQIDEQLQRINGTAQLVEEKYGFKPSNSGMLGVGTEEAGSMLGDMGGMA